jgi:hypothetical protein
MAISRLFWPQELLDQWIVDEKIVLEGERLTLVKENQVYRVKQALYFVADVGDGNDELKLVGRVKDISEIEAMGGEHYMDSVILEDSAYQVVNGFVGEQTPVAAQKTKTAPRSITDALANKNGEGEQDDKELLAKFLMENL